MDSNTKKDQPVKKLTLVSVNGRAAILLDAEVSPDGKVRVDLQEVAEWLGIPKGSCIGAY
jgi:hypothetical protein